MNTEGERLQKVLAHAGIASRRVCEQMIADGRVEVNGEVVSEMGRRVDPAVDVIHVDSTRVVIDADHLTIAFNKPTGVVSTMSDPEGRPTLADFMSRYNTRLFHVGRLDTPTQGLIILTNDGELAQRLAHPSWEVPKTYLCTVNGRVPRGLVKRLKQGVELEDGLAQADSVSVKETAPMASIIEITLHDGRNRIVRRMMDSVGHPVIELVRTQVGPIRLGDLRSGRSRIVKGAELGALMRSVGL
ncbi:MAG: pseudouridine synthase [Actinomycetota bacterium]